MFTGTFNSPYYENFMDSKIPLYLDLPCVTLGKMWLQHDGAPPYFGREVKGFLNENYELRRSGRN